jgi:hypothetical protein
VNRAGRDQEVIVFMRRDLVNEAGIIKRFFTTPAA